MGFFFVVIYYTSVLLRPQEWAFLPFLFETRLMFYTMILALIGWLFSTTKNAIPVHTTLLIGMLVVIILSSAFNGWLGGGLTIYFPAFAKAAVIPFTLMATLIKTRFQQKTLMLISIISVLVMVTNGVSQVNNGGLGWAGSTFSRGTTRITYLGTFNDPNDLGMLFVMVLPMIVYFFVRGGILVKLLAIASIAYVLQGILLTDSRGTLLGALALCGLWYIQKFKLKTAIITSGLLLPLVMIVLAKFREFDPNEGSAEGRWDAWYAGIGFLRSHPVFGIGYRQFGEEHGITAHNSFVLVFAELGLTGYFFWFSFLALTMIMLWSVMTFKTPFFNKDKLSVSLKKSGKIISEIDDEILISKVLFFSMVGYIVTGFFLSRSYSFLFYLFSGMSVSSYLRALTVLPDLKKITFAEQKAFLFKWMCYSIATIYIFTRVMLKWSG